MHVLMDSSIYCNDPKRGSAGFRAISRLAAAGRISIHVPYYVYKEFVTHQEDQLKNAIQKIRQGATTLTRLTDDQGIMSTAEAVLKKAGALETNLAAHAEEPFSTWITNVRAILQPVPKGRARVGPPAE